MSKFLKFRETAQISAGPAPSAAAGGGGGGTANYFEFVHFSNLLIYSTKINLFRTVSKAARNFYVSGGLFYIQSKDKNGRTAATVCRLIHLVYAGFVFSAVIVRLVSFP